MKIYTTYKKYKGIKKIDIINYLYELYSSNPEEYPKELKESNKIIDNAFKQIKESFNRLTQSNTLDQDIKDGHFD
jgi:hypothetical protein